MLKNKKSMICMIVFLMITLISSFCLADNEVSPTTESEQTAQPVTTSEDVASPEEDHSDLSQKIHEGDLFLFGTNVTMDQLVSGNVYIFANNVTVTGQVAGNMYIFANRVTVDQAYIQYSTYITATTVEFKGVTTDLYVNTMALTIPANYGAYRDLKVNAQTAYISGAVGRNAFINASHLSLEKEGATAMIFGNLSYTSAQEITIPEGSVEGEVQYSKTTHPNLAIGDLIQKYSILFFSAFVTALILFLLAHFFAKKTEERAVEAVNQKLLPTFGIGLLSIILVPIVAIILVLTLLGIPAALLLLAFYALLLCISIPVVTILLAKVVANRFHIERMLPQILVVLLVSIILSAIFLIPYVGIIVKLLLIVLGFGSMVIAMFFKSLGSTEKKEKKNKDKKVKKETTKKEKAEKDSSKKENKDSKKKNEEK